MIPTIGIMIGMYILTRSMEMALTERKSFGTKWTMGIMAILTALLTCACIKDLATAATKAESAFKGLGY